MVGAKPIHKQMFTGPSLTKFNEIWNKTLKFSLEQNVVSGVCSVHIVDTANAFDTVGCVLWRGPLPEYIMSHDDVIKWKHFPRYWPFVRGVPGEFPTQRPVTPSCDVFFDPRLNKRLSKQSWGWWFETLSRPLWRQCNELYGHWIQPYMWSVLLHKRSIWLSDLAKIY